MNAYAYNFLRRTQHAFSEHHNARESTLGFLSCGGQSPQRYVTALFHWENFLSQSWHAYALILKAWDGTAFRKNDGSLLQRLNAMYNQMKHVESRIDSGQMIPGATVPVWLEDQGLRSVDVKLTYHETADVLKELSQLADTLSNPQTAMAKLTQNDA